MPRKSCSPGTQIAFGSIRLWLSVYCSRTASDWGQGWWWKYWKETHDDQRVASIGHIPASAHSICIRVVRDMHRPFFRDVVQTRLRNDLLLDNNRFSNWIGNWRTTGQNVSGWARRILTSANWWSYCKWHFSGMFRLGKQYPSTNVFSKVKTSECFYKLIQADEIRSFIAASPVRKPGIFHALRK